MRYDKLILSDCDLSNNFFRKEFWPFSSHTTSIEVLNGSGFNVKELLTTFQNVERLGISGTSVNLTCLTDILSFNHRLSGLIFIFPKESSNCFTADQLFAFLKAQKPGFSLTIECYRGQNDEFLELRQALTQRFKTTWLKYFREPDLKFNLKGEPGYYIKQTTFYLY
uniref:Leucine-rich repeat domain-containing protein n=1 Tax=Panagrellus redivivus TaxID=6233 RepID=A0A7E4VLY3_PANRE